MEKIDLGGNTLSGQCDVVRLVARRLGISCLIEKRKRGGRPFFYGRFGEDVCPALGGGKRTRCVWWKNGWGGSLIEKAEKP